MIKISRPVDPKVGDMMRKLVKIAWWEQLLLICYIFPVLTGQTVSPDDDSGCTLDTSVEPAIFETGNPYENSARNCHQLWIISYDSFHFDRIVLNYKALNQ